LYQKGRSLVYSDPRMFGRVRFAVGKEVPEWWRDLPASIVSPAFTHALVHGILHRGRRSPIKALLLDQTLFPGIGNWMADEIAWQIKILPGTRACDLTPVQENDLWRVTRAICRTALKTIGADRGEPPKNWLIHCRWQKRGRCPRDGTLLDHAAIAGRTTAWCPVCQKPASIRPT
jgi:formamidopyrimidine-DNA glycosylase